MARLLSASTSAPSTTFPGLLSFINNQECFDLTFVSNSPQLHLTTPYHGAKETSVILSGIVNIFGSMCQIFIFCSLVEKKYIGIDNYDSRTILSDVEVALSRLKIQFLSRGALYYFKIYLEII